MSTYTEPSNGAYETCTEWDTVNQQNLQTAVGAAFGSFTTPEANLCTAHGDEHMYCLNDSGEKRYCHCETVSSNYHPHGFVSFKLFSRLINYESQL